MEKFILEEIPPDFQQVFFDRMKEGKDTTIEGLLLEFADKLDQVYEAFAELKRGNTDREFVIMYENALRKLISIPLPSTVDYFKGYILKDLMNEETQIDIKKITLNIINP